MIQVKHVSTGEGAEHENTIVEGSIARYAFAAGELTAGKVFEFEASVEVNDNNSSDTLTLGVRFGSSGTVTSNTDCGVTAAIDVADADQAVVRGRITVQSATRAVMTLIMNAPDAKGTTATYAHKTVLTIAEGTAYNLDVTLDWSVAHADNEAAASHFVVTEIS